MNDYLTAQDILTTIKELSQSQGFYQRLLKVLETSDDKKAILAKWAENNFKDRIDFILWIEQ